MKILVTNSDTPLAGTVATGLEAEHEVRRTLWDEPLEPGSATAALVQDVRAVVHFGYPRPDGDAGELLDHATRRTYNLLLAAAEAGVERCVFVSTLRLLAALPAHLAVTEKWRSRPPSADPALLACHLGEVVAKEVARDRLLQVATLRLGFPEVIGPRSALRRGARLGRHRFRTTRSPPWPRRCAPSWHRGRRYTCSRHCLEPAT